MTNKQQILSFLKNKRFVRTSLLFWGLIYVLLMLLQYTANRPDSFEGYYQVTIGAIIILFIFYYNFFLCVLYFVDKKKYYFLYNLLLLVIFIAVFYILILNAENIKELQAISHQSLNTTIFLKLVPILLVYLVIILLSTLYWSTSYVSKKTKENLGIQLQLQHMEKEKIVAEKQFLQSQINPHFLYNTLNFFYAKSLTHSEQLAESVLLLSDIMRYSLEQKENSNGMVFLTDEINHINNVVKINQLRFNNQLQIQFLVSGNTEKVRIVPLVLITLVENALKHGEMLTADYPVVIKLAINETTQEINFTVRNKKKNGPKERGTGIGLENTSRRLAFAYGTIHILDLKNEEEFFTASLQLPLFKDA